MDEAFDPTSESYGHGNNKTEGTKKSILHPDLKTIPRVPQVQLIGNGTVYDHEGLAEAKLKHPRDKTFHKTGVSAQECRCARAGQACAAPVRLEGARAREVDGPGDRVGRAGDGLE